MNEPAIASAVVVIARASPSRAYQTIRPEDDGLRVPVEHGVEERTEGTRRAGRSGYGAIQEVESVDDQERGPANPEPALSDHHRHYHIQQEAEVRQPVCLHPGPRQGDGQRLNGPPKPDLY
jgi:hypothetical protein